LPYPLTCVQQGYLECSTIQLRMWHSGLSSFNEMTIMYIYQNINKLIE